MAAANWGSYCHCSLQVGLYTESSCQLLHPIVCSTVENIQTYTLVAVIVLYFGYVPKECACIAQYQNAIEIRHLKVIFA